jgi:TonB family protein
VRQKTAKTEGRTKRFRLWLAGGAVPRPEGRRLLAAWASALGLHALALLWLTRQTEQVTVRPGEVEGTVVQTEVLKEPLLPGPLPPPRGGQVIESTGAARDESPDPDTRRIAEHDADTEAETRRRASSRDPGQRAEARRSARAAAPPRAPAPEADLPGSVAIAAPDAGAAAQTTADAGLGASAAADPGGAAAGISVDLSAHADDDLDDIPEGAETQIRAHASSYAGFINSVRDRVRRVWRVREAYQEADPAQRFRGEALVTEVAVRVLPDGRIARADVQKGSGLGPVDEEATAALRRAGPFPPTAGIADADGGLSFVFTFTFDLSPLRFLTAARQALLERWRPSRAFRMAGDRERVTAIRVLLDGQGVVVKVFPFASAGIDFLDASTVGALKPGDKLPAPPDSFHRLADGLVPLWVEFRHRVGAPADVRVLRRYRTTTD